MRVRLSLVQSQYSTAVSLKTGFCTHLLHASSAQACGRAISSSGFKLVERLRDCATRDNDKLTSCCGKSLA